MDLDFLWYLWTIEGLPQWKIADFVGIHKRSLQNILRTHPDYERVAPGKSRGFSRMWDIYGNKYKRASDLPTHWDRFDSMLQRAVSSSLDCDFERTNESFDRFIDYIGPIPDGMKRPTVGRIDHNRGYVIGNFRWQEFNENARLQDNLWELA